jgi:hypothetical protein
MKLSRLSVTLLALALALTALLSSCGARLVRIVPEENDLFRNTKTGATYQVLPASYEPISRGEEYGRLDQSGVEFILHEMPGQSTDEWLCSVYGDVYCRSDYEVVPFADWDIRALYVCTNTALVVSELTIKPSAIQSEVLCHRLYDLLRTAYAEGEGVYYPSYATPSRAYTLRFESEDMPGVYFCVKMIEYTEDIFEGETNLGRTFLYDRYADRCVAVPNVLFRMLDGARLEDVVSEAADHE